MVNDDCQAPFLGPSGTSFGIVRHQFWDRQAPILGSHVNFQGTKRSQNGVTRFVLGVFKRVLELPHGNICYISSHSDHVNHPLRPQPAEYIQEFVSPHVIKNIFCNPCDPLRHYICEYRVKDFCPPVCPLDFVTLMLKTKDFNYGPLPQACRAKKRVAIGNSFTPGGPAASVKAV